MILLCVGAIVDHSSNIFEQNEQCLSPSQCVPNTEVDPAITSPDGIVIMCSSYRIPHTRNKKEITHGLF